LLLPKNKDSNQNRHKKQTGKQIPWEPGKPQDHATTGRLHHKSQQKDSCRDHRSFAVRPRLNPGFSVFLVAHFGIKICGNKIQKGNFESNFIN